MSLSSEKNFFFHFFEAIYTNRSKKRNTKNDLKNPPHFNFVKEV